jgi:lysine-specific demethylase 8
LQSQYSPFLVVSERYKHNLMTSPLIANILEKLDFSDFLERSIISGSAAIHKQLLLVKDRLAQFFSTTRNNDHQYEVFQSIINELREIHTVSWAKLHTGYWKDVDLVWREIYSASSLLLALCIAVYNDVQKSFLQIEDAIKILDFALLMGAPNNREHIHSLIDYFCQQYDQNKTFSLPSEKCVEKRGLEDETENSVSRKKAKLEPKIKPRNKIISDTLGVPAISKDFEVPRITPPSVETFFREYMSKGRSVILTHLVDHWPALSKWKDIDYIRVLVNIPIENIQWISRQIIAAIKFIFRLAVLLPLESPFLFYEFFDQRVAGLRTVPVEIGQHYAKDDWSQQLMTVNDFIDIFILNDKEPPPETHATGKTGYIAQTELFEQIPAFKKDFTIPEYTALSKHDK